MKLKLQILLPFVVYTGMYETVKNSLYLWPTINLSGRFTSRVVRTPKTKFLKHWLDIVSPIDNLWHCTNQMSSLDPLLLLVGRQ